MTDIYTESDREMRDDLTAARDTIRHQLEVLISPSTIGGGADNREVIAELEAELAQIESALAER